VMKKPQAILHLIAVLAILLAFFVRIQAIASDDIQANVEAGMLTIIVDAGHGGGDPGKVGTLAYEKDINLAIALMLRDKLQMRGFRVIMTRDDEDGLTAGGSVWKKSVDMSMRREIIDSSNADIFVSIHQNSHANSRNRGAQVFYNGDIEMNQPFAEIVQKNLASVASVTNNRTCVDQRDLMMLRGNAMPSVLIECGFMSNKAEEQELCDPAYQEKIAGAIVKSICEYYNVKE